MFPCGILSADRHCVSCSDLNLRRWDRPGSCSSASSGTIRDLPGAASGLVRFRGVVMDIVGEFPQDPGPYASSHTGRYFAASDLVVDLYGAVSGSRIIRTAFGFDRPLVATCAESAPELHFNVFTMGRSEI